MRYDFEAEPLELDTEIEGETDYGELEYSSGNGELEYGNGELESDAEFDQETGAKVRRVINLPKIVDRETYDEFEIGEEITEEISPPSDTRKLIKDTTIFPFRFICHVAIKMKSADGRKRAIGHGSGTLIGNKYVLTVGHNTRLQHPADGMVYIAESISVAPGRNTSAPLTKRQPFGSVAAQSWKAHPNWVARFDPEYDFALITLKKEIGKETFRALGKKQLGYWGSPGFGGKTYLRVVDPVSSLKDVVVNVGGYPGDKCGDQPLSGSCPGDKEGGTQFCAYDKILDPSPTSEPRLFWHNVDTKAGQSGSPVWRWDKDSGQRNLVGVHTGGVADIISGAYLRNTAVRLTRDVLQTLTLWGWSA